MTIKYLYKSTGNRVSMLLVLLLTTLMIACAKTGSEGGGSYPKKVSLEYRITSITGGVSKITSGSYTNATGGDTFLNDEPLPFSRKFSRTVNRGDDLGLSLLHNNSTTSTPFSLKLDILLDGSIVKSETFIGSASTIGAIVYLFP